MNVSKIKILLVDDSSLMRLLISNILSEENNFEVLDSATNGEEAYQKTKELNPDVVIMDLVMQEYDGLYAVKKIMKEVPKPIIIVSALGNVDSQKIFEALEEGAYDFVNKPESVFNSKIRDIKFQLINKIRYAAESDVHILKTLNKKFYRNNNPHTFDKNLNYEILIIGASTGGTTAIETILSKMPQNLPIPVLIVQHIPNEFVYSFAHRLDMQTPFQVRVAQHNERIMTGNVYIAPSEQNIVVLKREKEVCFRLTNQQFESYNYPSVNGLMLSVAEIYKEKTLGVILTGMGRDGTLGMKKIFQNNGFTIAQNEATSVVFGMPKAAIEEGVIREVLPLNEIANFIVSCF